MEPLHNAHPDGILAIAPTYGKIVPIGNVSPPLPAEDGGYAFIFIIYMTVYEAG